MPVNLVRFFTVTKSRKGEIGEKVFVGRVEGIGRRFLSTTEVDGEFAVQVRLPKGTVIAFDRDVELSGAYVPCGQRSPGATLPACNATLAKFTRDEGHLEPCLLFQKGEGQRSWPIRLQYVCAGQIATIVKLP